jgi:carboxymethylenebutenolidase
MCLYDDCKTSRRSVLRAGLVLPLLGNAVARAEGVVRESAWQYERDGAKLDGYLAYPLADADAPVVVVLHGNAGLPADVCAMAVRLAAQGYVGFAVNPTSREPDPRTIPRELLAGREFGDRYIADARAGLKSLRERGIGGDRLGIVGYCGGGYTALLWGAEPYGGEIEAFVGIHTPFHNREGGRITTTRPQGIDLYRKLAARTQLHFGGADAYTPAADIAEVQAVAGETHKTLESYTYSGAEHGFALFTDAAYRSKATHLLHRRSRDFLRRHLHSR